jgi:hypothetical protein
MARSVKRLVGVVLASGGLVVACNAISGLDEDFQLGGGGTLPGEGGSSGGDGSIDASGSDATQPDGGPFRCPVPLPANQLFCDDFEDQAKAWTRNEIMPANSPLVVQAGIGVDGSAGLRAHANAASQSRKVARWQAVGTGANAFADGWRIRLRFRFKLETIGLNYFVLGAIQVNDQPNVTNAEYGLAVYKSCSGSPSPCLDENNPQGEGNSHSFEGQIGYEVGRWYDAAVTVARSGNTYSGTMTVDDKAIDTNGNTYFSGNPSKVEVGVGVFYTGADPGLEGGAIIDNVVVEKL